MSAVVGARQKMNQTQKQNATVSKTKPVKQLDMMEDQDMLYLDQDMLYEDGYQQPEDDDMMQQQGDDQQQQDDKQQEENQPQQQQGRGY